MGAPEQISSWVVDATCCPVDIPGLFYSQAPVQMTLPGVPCPFGRTGPTPYGQAMSAALLAAQRARAAHR